MIHHFFQDRIVLASKNDMVDFINEYMSLLSGEENTYLSLESPFSNYDEIDRPDDVHTPKFFNTITTPGLSNHQLKLKVGVSIMLLRNIDQFVGLCNGARLIIRKMSKYVLEGKVISRSKLGMKIYTPKLSSTPSYLIIPFKFQRRQFHLVVSFAMTINKSQSQSFKHDGVFFSQLFFFSWFVICYHIKSYI